MAEISIELLEELKSTINDADFSKFVEGLKNARVESVSFIDVFEKLGTTIFEKVKQGVDALSAYKGVMSDVQTAGSELWNGMIGGLQDFITEQDIAAEGTVVMGAQMALAIEPVLQLIPKGITGMGQLGDAGFSAGSKISEAFSGLSPMFEKALGKRRYESLEALANGATNAFALQREIANLAGTQGIFNSVLNETGSRFGDLNQMYLNHVNLTYESAKATGQIVASMMDLSKTLAPIPEALSTPISYADSSISQLTATSRLATGFMRDQADVAKHLADMYTNLGSSGDEAFINISNLYDKAGDSKLRFETFTNTVMNIAGSFKMLGDNTAAATNVVKAFDDVFKDSNMSPAALNDLINSISSGIDKMSGDMGKMAFVSGATGGPGGLAGSLEMELAIREGRMDEVLGKTMQAMQAQFGGQVLTLEDAAGNEQLAAEFVKQREYLKQVAGIAGDDAQANRILEAMKSGVVDGLSLGRETMETGGSDVLENAIDRGAAEQRRTNSILMTIHQDMEMGRLLQNDIFSGFAQTMTKPDSDIAARMENAAGTSRSIDTFNRNPDRVTLDRAGITSQYLDDAFPIITSALKKTTEMIEGSGGLGEAMQRFGVTTPTAETPAPRTETATAAETPYRDVTGLAVPRREVPLPEDVLNRAPMRLEDYGNAPFGIPGGAEGTEPWMQELEISYQPLEVKVSFDKPFEQQVRLIADQQISRARQGQVRAGANGRPM